VATVKGNLEVKNLYFQDLGNKKVPIPFEIGTYNKNFVGLLGLPSTSLRINFSSYIPRITK
jgi:hypothetical protein